jgi:diacylglycerol kinase family enzyme
VSLVVCKGRHYGGPFVAAPTASLTGGVFQVVLLDKPGWWNLWRYGFGLLFRCLPAVGGVRIFPGHEILVEGASGPVQADGDIIGSLPMRLSIDPEPVRLIHPS